MFSKALVRGLSVVAAVAAASAAQAAVVIETVSVGDPRNNAELSGKGAGGFGPDRLCGAVNYSYDIGKYEVTAGQYTEFLNAVAGVDTYGLYSTSMANTSYGSGVSRSGGGTSADPYTYTVGADFVNRPVNFVSFWDAARFANWLNNGQGDGDTETGAYTLNGYTGSDGRAISRNAGATWFLPSEDEWYKAAYYNPAKGDYYEYPTSSNDAPGQDMNDVSGNNANYYTSPYVYPIGAGRYTTLVGEFQSSDSPYGTFDQGGNLWEWNEAVVSGSQRGLRGGSFYNSPTYNVSALAGSGRNYDYPTDAWRNTGFRVARIAAVPEPGSIAIWLGGAVAGLMCWRRRR